MYLGQEFADMQLCTIITRQRQGDTGSLVLWLLNILRISFCVLMSLSWH